jgi:cyclic beta-1,2-glucan synthetase
LLFTHQRLLEWKASGDQDPPSRDDPLAVLRSMAFAPALAIATASWLALMNPAALPLAGPDPAAVAAVPRHRLVAQPAAAASRGAPERGTDALSRPHRAQDLGLFRDLRHPEDHWLPPDNYQEYRAATLAHRTSPTNMGLALLANLSAHDFGYIPTGQLLERTANALGQHGGLERHRGHFYNWYDTQTLRPLHPAYVSTVDSGNLAGHLLTCAPACWPCWTSRSCRRAVWTVCATRWAS